MTPDTTRITRRAMPGARLLGLTTLVAICGGLLVSAPSASAAVSWNGMALNGVPLNGMALNGLPINEMPLRRCGPEATQRASATRPPAGRFPWHRISHTAVGQR